MPKMASALVLDMPVCVRECVFSFLLLLFSFLFFLVRYLKQWRVVYLLMEPCNAELEDAENSWIWGWGCTSLTYPYPYPCTALLHGLVSLCAVLFWRLCASGTRVHLLSFGGSGAGGFIVNESDN